MRKNGWAIVAIAVGMLLAAGAPSPAVTAAQADPGCRHGCCLDGGCGPGCPRCDCECGHPCNAGQAAPPCMQDNAAAAPGGMHRRMRDGMGAPPFRKGMGTHMAEMRGTIAKLRALEAKMESLKSKDDAAAFRAASLEHSKLLADFQESHLKHMEGMMGGK